MELDTFKIENFDNIFPKADLPYEITTNTAIPIEYNIGLAIPYGKKSYIWFTFDKEQDNCYVININKNKRLTPVMCIHSHVNNPLSVGTLLYGTSIIDELTQSSIFIIEDIIMFKGMYMNKQIFYDKLIYIKYVIDCMREYNINYQLCLPVIWEANTQIPDNIVYQVHHIQYRILNMIKPYLNVESTRKTNNIENKNDTNLQVHCKVNHKMDFSKPQYKISTIFQCYADIQPDIYYLYAIGKSNLPVYYNVAGITDYNTSVLMNTIFRNIRENRNIDYIEESDDEDDFQNTNIDKYVDIRKMILLECSFNYRFRKWIPIREVKLTNKVIHINRLIYNK
jgi:hypothetical protein